MQQCSVEGGEDHGSTNRGCHTSSQPHGEGEVKKEMFNYMDVINCCAV